MTVQKCGSSPSVSLIISVVSVLLFCAGFIRVEMKLNEHEKRMNAVENVVEVKLPTNIPNDLTTTTADKLQEDLQIYKHRRNKRQADSAWNASYSETKKEFVAKLKTILSEGKLPLCQTTKEAMCPSGLPGPPGPPGPRGQRGARGRRGQKGRAGTKGNNGIMGSPGKSGKQGMMGPSGFRGETGSKGEKGNMGPPGKQGAKGEPGESISAPVVIGSPPSLTVNENEAASFQCSASGNPEPAVVWSKVSSQSVMNQSAVSGGKLRLMNVTGNESGLYQCTATNILGNATGLVRLVVNVHPRVVLNPGPIYVKERSNVTLPQCHVTGYPPPVVTWSMSGPFRQLPQGRVQNNSGELKIFDARKNDQGMFLCTASNLLGTAVGQTFLAVVALPKFTVKPSMKVVAAVGDTRTLNCSATGDPQPVISWKRQGAQLPVGRSHRSNDALIIRDLKVEDAGIYVCVAVSGGVFGVEAVSHIQVLKPKDCSALLKAGRTQSGVYSVDPDGGGLFSVYCDMQTDGGGWTVFQRRQDGSVDFYRGWNDYKSGFGQLTGEFWLGNDKIHRLTATRASSLRVELEDWNGVKVFAKYGRFRIGDEQAQYRLEVGSYSGSAGDSLAVHNNMAFSTKESDHDRWTGGNCAVSFTGAWWYEYCHHSNLNGKYLGDKSDLQGAMWYYFHRNYLSLKFTEMKLRPSS